MKNIKIGNENNIVFYEDKNNNTKVEVRLLDEDVWLNVEAIANLFNVKRPAITKHINNIYNDEEMNRLGFHMLIPVHDEILGECPEENASRCEERLVEIMTTCASSYLNVPMACDTYNVKSWYEDEYAETIIKQYKNYIEGNPKKNILPISSQEAMDKILEEHTEQPKEYILDIFEKIKN